MDERTKRIQGKIGNKMKDMNSSIKSVTYA